MKPKKKIHLDGTEEWRLPNGQLHREDGPARIHPNGSKFWYLHGKHHRTDGPAVTYPDGYQSWWLDGKYIISRKIDYGIMKSTLTDINLLSYYMSTT